MSQKITIQNNEVRISTNSENITNTTVVSLDDGLGRALVESGWMQPRKCSFPRCDKDATRFEFEWCVDGFCSSHYKAANEFTGNVHSISKFKRSDSKKVTA